MKSGLGLVLLAAMMALTLWLAGPRSPRELRSEPPSSTNVPSTGAPRAESEPKVAAASTPEQGPLQRFQLISKKALRSPEEDREWKLLLASEPARAEARAQLLALPLSGRAALRERFQSLHFYERALGWKQNPARTALLSDLSQILAREVTTPDQEHRKVLIGDKVEIYALLLREAPEEARVLKESVTDPKLTRILQFAQARYENEVIKE